MNTHTATATSPEAVHITAGFIGTNTGDAATVVEHAELVRATGAGAAITAQTMHTATDRQQHLLVDLDDEPLTAAHARELAAALLFSADQLDGRASAITVSQPGAQR